ncbi:hypothetical protein QNO07_25260 [Streptomyces sp. 549]|uniref:hypothetical protein n=1 Tax=Streptomyces sp. 549 TaxID=3049076 RepID=UPI0024C2281E|nr:hypothetical protein [Streptomyces sp. 549]MDK1476673.1 hypothetical protein [Streptomyces sp. 549]
MRWTGGGLAPLMSVTLVEGTSAASPQQSAPEKSKPAVTQAADIASAKVAARSGKRVEALSERTETSTTWADKDGSLTTELS